MRCLWQVEHICPHLWHRYSISFNQGMVETVTLSKWWLQLTNKRPCFSRFLVSSNACFGSKISNTDVFFSNVNRNTILIIFLCIFVTRLTRRVPLVEQELPTLTEYLGSHPTPVLSGVGFNRSLFVLFFWSLCCLSFY
jgi:hypothetical protein